MLLPGEAQVTISTDPHDQSSAPDLASDPYAVLRVHAQDRAGMARHAHGQRPDATGAQEPRKLDAVRLRQRLHGLPRRRGVRLGDVQPHHRPRLRADDPWHARQAASRPPQPGGEGLPAERPHTVGTRGDRPDLRSAGRRVQGRRRGRPGQGGDVRIPHPGHRRAARPAAGGPGAVPAVVAAADLDHRGHRSRSDGIGRTGHLLPRAGGPAPQQDDRRHHRRSRRCGDRRREAHRRSDHLVPAVASACWTRDHVSVVEQSAGATC